MSICEENFLKPPSFATGASRSNAERAEFVGDALHSLGHLRLRVHGESMLPTLWPDDVVEISACSLEELRPGEIVLARREGRLFLHRLVRSTAADSFRLRGDSVPQADPVYHREALLGRMDNHAGAKPAFPSVTLSRALGLFLCYCGIARRVALKLRRHFKRFVNELQTLEAS